MNVRRLCGLASCLCAAVQAREEVYWRFLWGEEGSQTGDSQRCLGFRAEAGSEQASQWEGDIHSPLSCPAWLSSARPVITSSSWVGRRHGGQPGCCVKGVWEAPAPDCEDFLGTPGLQFRAKIKSWEWTGNAHLFSRRNLPSPWLGAPSRQRRTPRPCRSPHPQTWASTAARVRSMARRISTSSRRTLLNTWTRTRTTTITWTGWVQAVLTPLARQSTHTRTQGTESTVLTAERYRQRCRTVVS